VTVNILGLVSSGRSPESLSSIMVIFGFTAIGIAVMTAVIGFLRKRAAMAMDKNGLPAVLQNDSDLDYASRLRKYFIKSANTNLMYYFAIGEAALGVVLLIIGGVAYVING